MEHRPGERVRELREAAGIGVRELARRAKLTSATISRIEGGGSWGRPATLAQIARALGVTVEELRREGAPELPGGIPCAGRIASDGTITDPHLDSPESPALAVDIPAVVERIAMPGAGPGWIAALLERVTPDPVSRDPGPDGAPRRWDLQAGDVVVFRPLPKGEDVPADKLVVVERPDPANEDDNVLHEVYVATRERGRITLWPLNGTEQRGMPKGWRVVAVGVEQRRGI